MSNPSVNINLVMAQLVVDALAQAGLTAVCIAPGSRSTPLTLAFSAHPAITTHLHLDERSAGFFALGMAIASQKPVALLCSSGTAVANFLPAVIEAKMSQVPLLLLTADRPHELRHSGANQTIDQVKIFADQLLWSVDMPLPHGSDTPLALRNAATTAVRAYHRAHGLPNGPVHLNFPFRTPLEPFADELKQYPTAVVPHIERGPAQLTPAQADALTQLLQSHGRGLIICGPRCPDPPFAEQLLTLAQRLGYPVLADPISGVRFCARNPTQAELIISGYETFLQKPPDWPQPELILRFGALPISKWLNGYLAQLPPVPSIHIRENGVWADEHQRTTHFFQANETAVIEQLLSRLDQRNNWEWPTAVAHTESRTWQRLETELYDPYFDGAVLADMVDLIGPQTTLFVGNSSPIRHLDQYGRGQGKPFFAYANRGASGIDGNLSTALGLHAVHQRRLVAVLGDLTFYHDLNGLWQLSRQQKLPELRQHVTIVLLNNDGGGIFNRLPIAQVEPPFTELFVTPHGIDFAPIAAGYGISFERASSRPQFRQLFAASLQRPQPCIIEVPGHGREAETRRRQINQIVNR